MEPRSHVEGVDRFERYAMARQGRTEKILGAVDIESSGLAEFHDKKVRWILVRLPRPESPLGARVKLCRCLAPERLMRTDVIEFLSPAIEQALLRLQVFGG